MNKEELKNIVAQMLRELNNQPGAEPTVKGSDYKPTQKPEEGGFLSDITNDDLRKQYLVEKAEKPAAFQELKSRTPARIGLGRAGSRYKTRTVLRFRADHAAAQDSVFSLVKEEFYQRNNLPFVQTKCKDKDEYLTRPDLGRVFDEENQKKIEKICKGHKVLLLIGDGLSSAAVEANALDCMAAIRQGLKTKGITPPESLFIQYCRVGAMDHIGEITDCELICLLVGERPGLVTNESMSAYIAYRPRRGIPESRRTVVSNIHNQGVAAIEAGAHVATLIVKMLQQKTSGVEFAKGEAG